MAKAMTASCDEWILQGRLAYLTVEVCCCHPIRQRSDHHQVTSPAGHVVWYSRQCLISKRILLQTQVFRVHWAARETAFTALRHQTAVHNVYPVEHTNLDFASKRYMRLTKQTADSILPFLFLPWSRMVFSSRINVALCHAIWHVT